MALDTCYSDPFPALNNDSDNILSYSDMPDKYIKELGDWIYMTCWLPEPSELDLHVIATLSQCLSETF